MKRAVKDRWTVMRRDRGPELTERFYRRMELWPFVGTFGGMALMMSAMFLHWPFELPVGTGWFTMYVVSTAIAGGMTIAVPAAWTIFMLTWESRLMRQLRESGYRLCPHCGFPLATPDETTRCPECGTSCNMREVEAAWRRFQPRISRLLRRSPSQGGM